MAYLSGLTFAKAIQTAGAIRTRMLPLRRGEMRIVSAVVPAIIAAILLPGVATAASNRTFVASTGSDAGTCARTAPCRSFAYAVTQTAPNGELLVLDSAGYGPFTITESITISNPSGVEAAISVPANASAITINANKPIDVTLRGLSLQGFGVGLNGILVTSSVASTESRAGSVNVIDCLIKDFVGSGINFAPSRTGGSRAPGPPMSATIANTYLLNNAQSGLYATQNSIFLRMLVSDLVASTNGIGVEFDGGTGAGSIEFTVVNSRIALNSSGLTTSGLMSGTIKNSVIKSSRLSAIDVVNNGNLSLVNNNQIGSLANNGQVQSDGTNVVGSASGGSFTPIVLR